MNKMVVTTLLCVVAGACADSELDASRSGSMSIAITEAPPDVACVVIDVAGTRNVERRFDVVAGSSTELQLNGLPLGAVQVSGNAFSDACDLLAGGAIAGWTGGPVDATLQAGTIAQVHLPMRRNGRAEVDADFIDDGACLADGNLCSVDTQCCSQQCLPDVNGATTCQPAPSCADGEIGGPCNSGLPGICASGTLVCSGGVFGCEPPPPQVETCNGVDDDCDGVVDNGACSSTCGDGQLAGGEQCDDGNIVNGDGCDANCTVESGFVCSGAPSVCTTI